MQKLTDITLNEMLTHKNEIIRRNAMSTLKQLQREQVGAINQPNCEITNCSSPNYDESAYCRKHLDERIRASGN